MTDEHYKLPRIYCKHPFAKGQSVPLTDGQAHYFHTVMRRKNGDQIRFFNQQDGEWIAELENLSKKSGFAACIEQIRPQSHANLRINLFFTPLPKNRMDLVIEKAVELGVHALYPIITQNTDVRKIKEDRIEAQIIEAAEQCERLDIPALHPLRPMQESIDKWFSATQDNPQFLACLERFEAKPIAAHKQASGDIAVLIGPIGGFTLQEKDALATQTNIVPVSLGNTILRVETAALFALSVLKS